MGPAGQKISSDKKLLKIKVEGSKLMSLFFFIKMLSDKKNLTAGPSFGSGVVICQKAILIGLQGTL